MQKDPDYSQYSLQLESCKADEEQIDDPEKFQKYCKLFYVKPDAFKQTNNLHKSDVSQ